MPDSRSELPRKALRRGEDMPTFENDKLIEAVANSISNAWETVL